jgi:ElaB/YqjD/DUF883 family membrane-anchored ribosome-binding protein
MRPHIESPTTDGPTLRERAADALHQAAHLSREARLLKTMAEDAVEDGMHAAKRTIKHARQTAVSARDELAYRVKREPMKAMAVIFAAGALLGLGLGLACRRQTRRATS